MNAFVISVTVFFSLTAAITVWELMSKEFPLQREPLTVSTNTGVLLLSAVFTIWGWLLLVQA